jgi:hypothetical protein
MERGGGRCRSQSARFFKQGLTRWSRGPAGGSAGKFYAIPQITWSRGAGSRPPVSSSAAGLYFGRVIRILLLCGSAANPPDRLATPIAAPSSAADHPREHYGYQTRRLLQWRREEGDEWSSGLRGRQVSALTSLNGSSPVARTVEIAPPQRVSPARGPGEAGTTKSWRARVGSAAALSTIFGRDHQS